MPKKFFCLDPPQPIVADDLGALVVAGSTALGAVWKCKDDGIGIVLVRLPHGEALLMALFVQVNQ